MKKRISSRLKITLYSFIVFVVIGVLAYIYHPDNLNELGGYLLATSLPLLTYIISRSFRGQSLVNTKNAGTRFKVSVWVFHIYITIGCIAYYFQPDYITQLTGYVAAISAPIMTYIIGKTIRETGVINKEEQN